VCGADNLPARRREPRVHFVVGQRPERCDLAEINSDKIARLQTARHFLCPWQRRVRHHDDRPTANRCIA